MHYCGTYLDFPTSCGLLVALIVLGINKNDRIIVVGEINCSTGYIYGRAGLMEP